MAKLTSGVGRYVKFVAAGRDVALVTAVTLKSHISVAEDVIFCSIL
jgi:hypothetical protein